LNVYELLVSFKDWCYKHRLFLIGSAVGATGIVVMEFAIDYLSDLRRPIGCFIALLTKDPSYC